MELLLVHIQSECGKISTRNNSVFGHFSRSEFCHQFMYRSTTDCTGCLGTLNVPWQRYTPWSRQTKQKIDSQIDSDFSKSLLSTRWASWLNTYWFFSRKINIVTLARKKKWTYISQWPSCIYCIWILNKFDMHRCNVVSRVTISNYSNFKKISIS